MFQGTIPVSYTHLDVYKRQSQVRASMGVKPSATFFGRLHSFLFVWSFVVCLHVFSDESRNHTLGERLSFLASLFGVS